MKTIFEKSSGIDGINLTDEQAYLKTGATFSIGYESNLYPVFTLDMANTVVNDAKKNNYGLVSMWSMGRDAMLEKNSAITTQYNYTNILKAVHDDLDSYIEDDDEEE